MNKRIMKKKISRFYKEKITCLINPSLYDEPIDPRKIKRYARYYAKTKPEFSKIMKTMMKWKNINDEYRSINRWKRSF